MLAEKAVNCVMIWSSTIKIRAGRGMHQAAVRVALHTTFKVGIQLRTDFREKNVTIHKVGYPGESVIQRLSMRDSSVVIMSTSKNSPYGKGLCRITFAIV